MKLIVMLLVAGVLLALILVPLFVTQIEARQAREVARYQSKGSASTPRNPAVLVVYFSRSGTTGLTARHLADRLGADIIELKAADYRLGVIGWIHSLRDARHHRARISPGAIDLGKYSTVYLGSPIWLYSPAPPIWEFVESNRFDGKQVVLFNTFNSKFEQHYIDTFREKVMQRGARGFEHRFVRRGRMGAQITPDEMLSTIDEAWSLVPSGSASN